MAKRESTGDPIRSGDTLVPTKFSDDRSVVTPYYLCGPTASGKSALALEMARELDGEIVNADAFQLYRGLEIVSAAPPLEERALIPHHLYGILDPTEAADAGTYMRLAKPVIAEIQSRGKTPIITGGSGLYLKFLTLGPLRPNVFTAVRNFLRCGDLAAGFLRFHCPDCGHERLLAFTCKGRHLCPACHQRRVRQTADWIATAVCHEVPHRQFVLIPDPRPPCPATENRRSRRTHRNFTTR